MLVLFLHGWQSTPGGVKPTYLKDHGHTVLNPLLPDDNFEAAVTIAQVEFDRHHPDVVVGFSRGGAVAMRINADSTPLVLLCPAWKRWRTVGSVKPGTVILHSKADDVVPLADSLELVRDGKLPQQSLIVVGSGHRLADEESLAEMLEAVEGVYAPCQFGISTLLVITAMYAVLFATLRAFHAPPSVFVLVALFFTAVGLGRRFLFKGRQPAWASMIVGACFFVGLYLVYWVVGRGYLHHPFLLAPFDPLEGALFGAIMGYLVGLLIAAAFLLIRMQKVFWNQRGGREGTA